MTTIQSAAVVAATADRVNAKMEQTLAEARARELKRWVDPAANDINAGATDSAKYGSRFSMTDIFIGGADCSLREEAIATLRRQLTDAKYQPMAGRSDYFHIDRPSSQLNRGSDVPYSAAQVSVVIIADPDSKPATIVPHPTTVCPAK